MRTDTNEWVLRKELSRISINVYKRGLVGGTGGNVSVRLEDGHLLITPSGVSLADTTVDNIVKVDMESLEWIENKPYIPSKEYKFHVEILNAGQDINAVVHCHPPFATAYAVRKIDIPAVTDAAFKQPKMPHVPFAPSGSERLVDNIRTVVQEQKNYRVLLLDQHGIVTVGEDLVQAYNFADLTEEMARIAWLTYLIKD